MIVVPGTPVACATFPAQVGCVTVALARNGATWIVSCSHVVVPDPIVAMAGDSVLVDGQAAAHLSAWTKLSDFAVVDVDLALSKAVAGTGETASWSDGRPFAGFAKLGTAPIAVRIFGKDPAGIGAKVSGAAQATLLDLPTGGRAKYLSQVPLACDAGAVVTYGDSGAAVRDANDRLVGIVVGTTPDGSTAWCTPWEVAQAEIDRWLAPA